MKISSTCLWLRGGSFSSPDTRLECFFKGSEIFHEKFKGSEIFLENYKGFENLCEMLRRREIVL